MKRKLSQEDDGRVIANMNVEGMPWYSPHSASSEGEPLSRRDLTRVIFSATLYSLLIGLILSAGVVLFVLFCTHIWLR